MERNDTMTLVDYFPEEEEEGEGVKSIELQSEAFQRKVSAFQNQNIKTLPPKMHPTRIQENDVERARTHGFKRNAHLVEVDLEERTPKASQSSNQSLSGQDHGKQEMQPQHGSLPQEEHKVAPRQTLERVTEEAIDFEFEKENEDEAQFRTLPSVFKFLEEEKRQKENPESLCSGSFSEKKRDSVIHSHFGCTL